MDGAPLRSSGSPTRGSLRISGAAFKAIVDLLPKGPTRGPLSQDRAAAASRFLYDPQGVSFFLEAGRTSAVTGRCVLRALCGLLCTALIAAACSSDSESPVASGDDSLGEFADVKDNWPHCARYGELQAAIVEMEDAREAARVAQEVLVDASDDYEQVSEGTDRVVIADAAENLESATAAMRSAEERLAAANEAVLSAQTLVRIAAEAAIENTSLDDEDRYAAQAAADAYAAALDAANLAARGTPLPDAKSEAYREAADAATRAAQALTDSQRTTAQARVDNAQHRVERATEAHQAALDEVSGHEDAVGAADDLLSARSTEAGRVAGTVESELAAQIEVTRADALTPLREQIFGLEMITLLATSGTSTGADFDTAGEAAHQDAAAVYVAAGGAHDWGQRVGLLASVSVAYDAYIAAYAALSERLAQLAEEAGLPTEVLSSYRSLLTDRSDAWANAERLNWAEAVHYLISGPYAGYADSAAIAVLNDQDVYDELAYQLLVRYARTSAADLVPVDESVAAAEREEQAWSADSQARGSFEAAGRALDADRANAISEHRLNNLGDPTLDNIAWRGFHAAVEALSSAAQEKLNSLRAESDAISRSNDAEMQSMVESDPRMIAARQTVAEAETMLSAERDLLLESRQQASAAQAELTAAETELRQANAAVVNSRPPHDRALLAAWLAVGEAAGCR